MQIRQFILPNFAASIKLVLGNKDVGDINKFANLGHD